MIQGKNPRTKSAPKRSVREASGPNQAGATTGCLWWKAHGLASLLPPVLRFSFVAFRFLARFLVFALLKYDVSGHPIDPIALNPPFFSFI